MNRFYNEMKKQSDFKLIEIVNVERDKYNTDAVLAAEQVLKERGLDTKETEKIESIVAAEKQKNHYKTQESLTTGEKLRFLLLPFLPSKNGPLTFKADGYDKKSRQAFTFKIIGLLLYAITIGLLSNL